MNSPSRAGIKKIHGFSIGDNEKDRLVQISKRTHITQTGILEILIRNATPEFIFMEIRKKNLMPLEHEKNSDPTTTPGLSNE